MTALSHFSSVCFRSGFAAALLIVVGVLAMQSDGQIVSRLRPGKPIDTNAERVATPPLEVTVPTANKVYISSFQIPITVDDITGDGIFNYQMVIQFDPAVIHPVPATSGWCSTSGTITGNASAGATCNVDPMTPNMLRIVVFGSNDMAGSGTLLNMNFTTTTGALPGQFSDLTFTENLFFNAGGPVPTNPHNGRITLVAPTAAEVGLAGRVLTAGGRGISNVSVVLSGGDLQQPRYAQTGSLGWYNFENVQAGQTYIVSISSKRYTFTVPVRVITLSDELTNIDFVSEP